MVETDPQLAQEQAFQMQALLHEDIPYIPLYNPQIFDLIHERVVLPYWPEFGGIIGNAGFQTDARVLKK
jgi:ABC-type transport system substrate-binding protein